MTEQKLIHKYQAFGTVEGVLNYSKKKHSTLVINEIEFPVLGYVPKQVRQLRVIGEIQQFKVFPIAFYGKAAFRVLNIAQDSEVEVELKLKGCWQEVQGTPYLVVYRNRLENESDEVRRILVPVVWENAPPTDGKFWDLRAQVQGSEFVITKAEGPFEPPPKATRFVPSEPAKAPHPASVPAEAAIAPVFIKPLTAQEIYAMATAAKISLTCKLNQVVRFVPS